MIFLFVLVGDRVGFSFWLNYMIWGLKCFYWFVDFMREGEGGSGGLFGVGVVVFVRVGE